MDIIRADLPYQRNSSLWYQSLRQLGDGFLLESGDRHPGHHVDIMSVTPVEKQKLGVHADQTQLQSALQYIKEHLQSLNPRSAKPGSVPDQPYPGWYGLWSYDVGRLTENVELKSPSLNLPHFWMGFFPSILVTNHLKKESYLIGLKDYDAHFHMLKQHVKNVTTSTGSAELTPSTEDFHLTRAFQSNLNKDMYAERFQTIQRYIHQGDCYQINLAQRFTADYKGNPWPAYCRLQQHTQSPMGCYFEVDDWSVLSTSPERFIKIQGNQVETKPIKGTRPRHKTPIKDAQLAQALVNSEKDRAENLMIVDLLRNDLGRSCKTGSVSVAKLFDVESFSNVHHLVSTITGELKEDLHPLDLLMKAFPGGSITGAPKHRAMEIIDELEPHGRSIYCGIAVYYDIAGNLDSNILIRSLVAFENQIHCWAGGGIVADSICEEEYRETLDKVGHLLRLLS